MTTCLMSQQYLRYLMLTFATKKLSTGINSISSFLTHLKRIQNPYSVFRDFGVDKTFTTRLSGCRVQVWVQVRAHACHLAFSPCRSSGNHSQRLFTPEGYFNRRFWLQNQSQSSWGSAPAQLGQVGLASTNKGRFRGRGSCCWQSTFFQVSCEMKFSMELARSCCWPKLLSLLWSTFRSFIGLSGLDVQLEQSENDNPLCKKLIQDC